MHYNKTTREALYCITVSLYKFFGKIRYQMKNEMNDLYTDEMNASRGFFFKLESLRFSTRRVGRVSPVSS